MKNVIEVKNLKKKYPNFYLDINSLKIPSGFITGIIGENGAGKTTLIKLLINAINKDAGKINIFGKNMEDSLIKNDIGVVLDNAFFPENLTANDIQIIMKDMFNAWDSNLFNKYLKKFKLKNNQLIKTMSKGERKKLEISTALSHKPKLLILDEPTSGLDPVARNEVLNEFLNFVKDDEHTIILSTHITSDLDRIADYICFINNGKIELEKERNDLFDNYGILKCSLDDLNKIDKNDIVSYRKNKYSCDVLISDKVKCKKKYKKFIIDNITLEELMLLLIKKEM